MAQRCFQVGHIITTLGAPGPKHELDASVLHIKDYRWVHSAQHSADAQLAF